MVASAQQPLVRITDMSAVAEAFLHSDDPLPDRLAQLCASLQVRTRLVFTSSWFLRTVDCFFVMDD